MMRALTAEDNVLTVRLTERLHTSTVKMIQAPNTVSKPARQSGTGLHLFSGNLKAFLMGLVLLLSLGSNISLYASELKEDDLLLLDFNLERQRLASAVTAYSYRNAAVISLAEAGAALEFPILVNPQAGSASGWFIRPERTFKLDINEGFVEIEGKRLPLKPDEALVHNDAIFVTLETFSSWFPATLKLNRSTLSVEVDARERLPLQERLARRKGAGEVTSIGPATLPLIETPYKLLGPHAADIGLGYSIQRRDDGGKSVTGLNYSAMLSGDIAFMDSHIYLSGSDVDVLSQARISLTRDNLGMPLGLRYLEVGDIVPAIVPGLSYSGIERGFLVQGGGSLVGRDDLIGSDLINLSGDALPGWDVELFQNGMRIGLQTVGPDGRYNFINIDPQPGKNDFELVFYGPSGERRSEVRTRYAGLEPDLPGSVRYQFSASQKGEPIYQGDSIYNLGLTDQGTSRFAAGLDVRVLPNMALRGSWNNLVENGKRLNYSSLGLRTSWRDIEFSADSTHDPLQGSRWQGSIQVPANAKIWGFDTRLSHTQYAQSVVLDDGFDTRLTSRTALTVNGPIKSAMTNFSLFHYRELNRNSQGASAGFTLRDQKTTFGNIFNYQQFGLDSNGVRAPDRLSGSLFFNSRAYPLSLRGGVFYTLKPEVEARQYFIDSNLTVAKDMTMNFGLTYNPLTDVTRYTSGFNWQLPQVTLSPRINYDSDGDYSGFVYASFSLAPRPDRPGVLMSGRSMTSSGTTAARVFLDNDGSNDLSEGDEPLPDVIIRAPQASRNAKTDAKGVAYLTGMSSDRATDIRLDKGSLPDTRMNSTHEGNSVKPRPTAIAVVDFPVIPTGEIDGRVYTIQLGKKAPLAGAMVELRNAEDKVVSFKITASDGFFTFSDMPLASYRLNLAGQQRELANQPSIILNRNQTSHSDVEIVIAAAATAMDTAIAPRPVSVVAPEKMATIPQRPETAVVVNEKAKPPTVAPLSMPTKPAVSLPATIRTTPLKSPDGRLAQLGAFANSEGAHTLREKLISLGGLQADQIRIVTVDLGKHGFFHRVVAMPIESTADALCSSLKAQGIECFTIPE